MNHTLTIHSHTNAVPGAVTTYTIRCACGWTTTAHGYNDRKAKVTQHLGSQQQADKT